MSHNQNVSMMTPESPFFLSVTADRSSTVDGAVDCPFAWLASQPCCPPDAAGSLPTGRRTGPGGC